MIRIRALLLLGLFLFGGLAQAAALSERSAVRLGLWWDPAASGSGFELFAAGEDLALVWYTYRDGGQPAWYTAHGRFDARNEWHAALQKQRWVDGRREVSNVGELRLTRQHAEKIGLQWTLGGRQGELALVPFPVSGIVPEIDHSGAFYDPRRPGFGLSLTEQGESVIAALYFYDVAGEPTWRVGDNAGRGDRLAMRGYRGPCPGCSGSVTPLDSGELELVRGDESTVRAKYTGAATAAWPLDGELRQLSVPASQRPADRQLAHFDDDAHLRRWVDAALLNTPPVPLVLDFSPPPAQSTFSSTNVQEADVDEADTLKSDGRWLYTFATAAGSPQRVLRVAETQEGANLQVHANLELASLHADGEQEGLYLDDDTLVVLSGTAPTYYQGSAAWSDFWLWREGQTRVELLDRANPRLPQSRARLAFDGHLIASRRIGHRLYLVLRKSVYVPTLVYPLQAPANLDANRQRIAAVPLSDLLPQIQIDDGAPRTLVTADRIYLPVSGGLPASPEFITVVGVDLDAPSKPDAVAIAGSVNAVYVSSQRLYVATTRNEPRFDAVTGSSSSSLAVTDIHELALGDDGPTVAGSGAVEGFLDRDIDRAVFRFSEKDGRLRVVTVSSQWGALGQNRLTVLEPSTVTPGLLKTLSFLPNRDRPQPLGKPGEQLYATRYLGDTLYAVTFLRTDPLYVVDIADPARPRIAGQVELPGYSDYLHPVGENLLLGIGLDAVESSGFSGPTAFFQGLQFSLFDVSDPARPRVMQQEKLGKRGTQSALLRNHHALSALGTAAGMDLALPVRVHAPVAGDPPLTSPSSYERWSWSGLQKLHVVGRTPQDARLVVGKALVTYSRALGNDPGYDDAAIGARAVQFTRGTVYVERGRFWLADAQGTLLAGPL